MADHRRPGLERGGDDPCCRRRPTAMQAERSAPATAGRCRIRCRQRSTARRASRRQTRPRQGGRRSAGTLQVGEELTASASGISDADGLDNASFGYQWIRAGADIGGATSSTYTPVAPDEGERLKVRVSFTDDAGQPRAPHQRGDRCRRRGAEHASGGRAGDRRDGAGRGGADRLDVGHLRRRWAGQRELRLPVDPHGHRHSGGGRLDLYGGGCR